MTYRHINRKSLLKYAIVILIAYSLSLFVAPGWITYAIALPAYVIVGLTCLSRANHLDEDTHRADVRRLGFSVMAGLIFMHTVEPIWGQFPNWPKVWMSWSLSMIWLTTEGLPPWWQIVTGAWDDQSFWQKVKLFLKSVHGSK